MRFWCIFAFSTYVYSLNSLNLRSLNVLCWWHVYGSFGSIFPFYIKNIDNFMFAFIWIFTVTCVWWCEVYKRLIAKRWHQLCWAYFGMIQKLVKSFSILFTPSNNITLELLNCALFTCLYEQHTVQLHLQFECKNQRSTNMLHFFFFYMRLIYFFW